MTEHTESEFVAHTVCDECGSSDGNAVFDDGHTYCFVCQVRKAEEAGEDRRPAKPKVKAQLVENIEIRPLSPRKISDETTRKFGYGYARMRHPESGEMEPVQVAPYYDANNHLIGQKVRWKDKEFRFLGDIKKSRLFGQKLWRDAGNKVVITEGEIDAMAVSQMQGNKWPVVSIPNGTDGAEKAIRREIEWLEQFEEVIFMFDMDEVGQKAARQCAALITPGKAKIASLPHKDAGECLLKGQTKAVIDAIWGAKTYRPDGIIEGCEITVDDLDEACTKGYDTQYPKLDSQTMGIRKGELTLVTAGSGIGKSTLVRQLGWYMATNHALRMGNVFLEENYKKTSQGYVALDNSVPLGDFRFDPTILSREAKQASIDKLFNTNLVNFHSHFGSLESQNLLSKLRYFAVGLECDFILLDHITIATSGIETDNERKDIDVLMTRLRELIEQTGIGVIAVCHLNMGDKGGKSHEEGGRVTLRHLRGSGALKQLSDAIWAMERDQQGDNSNVSMIRNLKNREFGVVGPADYIAYDPQTGLLLPCDPPRKDEDDEEEVEF